MKKNLRTTNLKILVTGGSGFIGSALIRYLINQTNFSVVNIDKLTYASNLLSLKAINNNKKYFFEKTDITKIKNLKRILNFHRPDIVMHLAAETHVDRSINNSNKFIKTNILGTYNLIEQVRIYWSNLRGSKKEKFIFHHISTDEVYGDLPHPDNYNGKLPLFSEESAYKPSSPYSASKASSDHLVRAWHRTYGLPVVISNCSNNYGPFQHPEKLIPLSILNAIKKKPIPVYAKGNQIRDWLYVDDHVRALVLIAFKGKAGNTYNIGGNNEKKNIEVVKTICKYMDKFSPIHKTNLNIQKYEELITFVKDRPGHDMRYAIDTTKIKKELGWAPQETFDSGMLKTIKWYLNNHK